MRKSLMSPVLLSLLLGSPVTAQFVAFNDHYSGTNTHPNATTWNVFGDTGLSGPLKDISSGMTLPVTLSVTNVGATGGASAAGPAVGTPAYATFNQPVNYIDWGNGGVNHSTLVGPSQVVGHVFTGLSPSKRYIFKGTAVRGGAYPNRWTLFELADAVSFVSAHSSGTLTSVQYPGSIAVNEAAVNTGQNHTTSDGNIVVWENIDPGPDGSFAVLSKQYLGPIPSGTAGDAYAYGLAALRLEEYLPVPTPVSFSDQPQDKTVNEFQPVTFSARASGNPSPTIQWYRVDGTVTNLLANATNSSYTVASVSPSDNGAKFFASARNVVDGVPYTVTSTAATLTVIADTTPPTLVTAFASSTMTNVTVLLSEPITASSAATLSNYLITNSASGAFVSILSVVLDPNLSNIVLTTSRLTNGATYRLVVNGLRDRSAAGNMIALNTSTSFVAQSSFTVASLGSPNPVATWVPASNGGDMTSGGTDIGFGATSDSCGFAYQSKTGDFDVQVRVARFSISDPWSKAALMARAQPPSPTGAYVAAVATPGMNGCMFQARTLTSGGTVSSGSFPINFPHTWLRLQRVNLTNFIGYASADGVTWFRLGSAVVNMTDPVALGFATSSHANGVPVTVEFRDFGSVETTMASIGTTLPVEPLGPSSRKTGLVISEIMYHPGNVLNGTNTNSFEFIEIYNSQPFFEDIGGYRISGDVHYTFPANTVLPGGGFVVVARDPQNVESVYGLTGVKGPWFADGDAEKAGDTTGNALPDDSGNVRLRNRAGAVLLDVNYRTSEPWPIVADGNGHSLVLARPSYGEADARAWGSSAQIGGSPGNYDPVPSDPLQNVVINEFLANSSGSGFDDYIELYNHSRQTVNLTGAWLSDDRDTNRFRIPEGTLLGATSFVVFARSELGFGLGAADGRIFLVNSNATRVLDAVRYDGQAEGLPTGRFPDGAPAFRELTAPTPGACNASILLRDIVINEIMYNPISGQDNDEYVELYNRGTNAVDLFRWEFDSGINFQFTNSTIIPAGGYLVVAKHKAALKGKYNHLNDTNTVGDYAGTLANGGERIRLTMPAWSYSTNANNIVTSNRIQVVANELTYSDGGRWGNWSDGGGSSLELMDARSDNRLASNWGDSDETQKGVWTTVEYTGPIGETLGSPINENIHINQMGVGECLVDDVQVIVGGANVVINPSFEDNLANWFPQGSHDQSTIELTGAPGAGGQSLHLRAGSRGDNGANRVRSATFVGASGTITIRAQAKWLRGWPELLVRLHGGGAEAYGPLRYTSNLGTPGAANSRAVSNAGPATWDVNHSPALPAANEAIQVVARAFDPDGITSLLLLYRVDPDMNYEPLPMLDNGTGGDAVAGDGLCTATIPGQATGKTVAFYVRAVDALSATNLFPQDVFPTAPLVRAFPTDAPLRECVVRWGDVQMPGSFATYHLWVTATNTLRWTNRDHLNNSLMDGTFVYNNYRVIYNSLPNFGGSPWHRGQMTTGPAGSQNVDYVQNFPTDDRFLGATDSTLCNPGNPSGTTSSDTSAQSEQASYVIFKEIGVHYNYRRYFHWFVNGSQRSKTSDRAGNFIFEDAQQPNGDEVDEWFPDDTEGQLFKIEDWFEFPDNGYDFTANNDADLARRTIVVNGQTNLYIAPYRYMFRLRSLGPGESANNYQTFFAVVDAVSPASNPNANPLPNPAAFDALVNTEQWLRVFACQHAAGNWDSYGFGRGKNSYMYKPKMGRFEQMTWDIDFTMGVGGNGATDSIWTGITDPRLVIMINSTPVYTRAYLRAMEDIVNGPLNNSFLDPILNAKHAALVANNVNVNSGTVDTIKNYTRDRRANLITQIAAATGASFAVNTPTYFETNDNIITIGGTAPVKIKTILVNGVEYPLTWSGVSTAPTSWTLRLGLNVGTNIFSIQGVDLNGNSVSGASNRIAINYTGPGVTPKGAIVINEIMYNPVVSNGVFIEILNTSSFTFDISGWRINGLSDYTFPGGTFITNGQYLVLAKDRAAFAAAFGNVPVFDEFDGNLDGNGETLTLFQPDAESGQEIVIDKVRYERTRPWPSTGNNLSLQLVDAAQDNSRAGNWSAGALWRYHSYTANSGTAGGVLYIFPTDSTLPCDLYLDDLRLVFGTNANGNTNLLRNAGFEAGTNTYWGFRAGATNSTVVNNIAHDGDYSLHLVCSGAGGLNYSVAHQIAGYVPSSVYTLSYWYLPGTNVAALNAQIGDIRIIFRTKNSDVSYVRYTPGAPNSVAGVLPAFPPLWLNEVQAENLSTRSNRFGQFAPWVELYNAGSQPQDLGGLFLANNYSTNMTQWAFPSGTTINPGEFKTIWLDGLAESSIPEELHANFTIPALTGSVALVRIVNTQPQVVDYLNYFGLGPTLSYGDYPDGQPFNRQTFFNVTFGRTNDATSRLLYINEWMAQNNEMGDNGIPGAADPEDNDYDDWFELYNSLPFPIPLGGYFLTDSTNNKTQYRIPQGYSVPANGFMLVWADNETDQNSATNDLHVNFQLGRGGEQIALYDPQTNLVDFVQFFVQTNNISEGRWGNGSLNRIFMPNPTPGTGNMWFANQAPGLGPIGDLVVTQGQTLSLEITATDPNAASQILNYHFGASPLPGTSLYSSNNVGYFTWVPRPEQSGAYVIPIWVEDNGLPRLRATNTLSVFVEATNTVQNTPPVITQIPNQSATVGQLLSFTVSASDAQVPPQVLSYSLEPGAPSGATIHPQTGVFSWTPAATGTNPITVRVMDNGVPPLGSTSSFTVTVLQVAGPQLLITVAGGQATISWPGSAVGYNLQLTTSPGAAWVDYSGTVTSNGNFSVQLPVTTNQFFRLIKP